MTPTTNGNGYHDYPDYADWTLRKAIVNAVVHRDYEIEFRNPRGSDTMLSSQACQSHSEE